MFGLAGAAHASAATQPASQLHVSPDLSELQAFGEHARTYRIMLILLQVGAILTSAKLMGWLCEKVKVPGVIGELLAGAIIGPFLLGHIIHIPIEGHWIPLFPQPTSAQQWPVNEVVWTLAQFASIVLLFVTGLHTDLNQFLRYVGPAAFVATLGVIVPFALGTAVVYIPFFSALSRSSPGEMVFIPALFVGSILAATSIGITARVLSDINRLDSPEGVTIIGAAVLDDVLGIIVLAIVGGIASSGSVSLGSVSLVALRAMGFWIALTLLAFVLARPLERILLKINYAGAMVAMGLSLAFICSAAAEGFGLAFIIGAYSVGLGLSRTQAAHRLMAELRPIGEFIVPIFFAVLGMLVNFHAMASDWRVLLFGLVVTLAAMLGKVLGCGAAALGTGFNLLGALRVGIGMMPRGEVALIVAGVGLSRHIIGENVFGVSIMMTLLTTIVAPMLLVPAFACGGSGRAARPPANQLPAVCAEPGIVLRLPEDLGAIVLNRFLQFAHDAGWAATLDDPTDQLYLLRSDGDAAQVRLDRGAIHINATDVRQAELNAILDQARQSIAHDALATQPQAEPQPLASSTTRTT
ncbi:cation:proton antiporter [Fontivita pretiosa]|uniref:cation:proton antiporter n=1 Tax=Fontivita pretiosa TaxID=2989684 RepID=UPI003D16D18E